MSSRYEKGLEVMRHHLGDKVDEYVDNIAEIAPLFARVNVEFAYGDIYGDEHAALDAATRELVTVGALTVMGHAQNQLRLHIDAALRCGASQQAVVDVITQMIAYIGFPAATDAILVAKDVFKERGLL